MLKTLQKDHGVLISTQESGSRQRFLFKKGIDDEVAKLATRCYVGLRKLAPQRYLYVNAKREACPRNPAAHTMSSDRT